VKAIRKYDITSGQAMVPTVVEFLGVDMDCCHVWLHAIVDPGTDELLRAFWSFPVDTTFGDENDFGRFRYLGFAKEEGMFAAPPVHVFTLREWA